jgi:hypothetical protein
MDLAGQRIKIRHRAAFLICRQPLAAGDAVNLLLRTALRVWVKEHCKEKRLECGSNLKKVSRDTGRHLTSNAHRFSSR